MNRRESLSSLAAGVLGSLELEATAEVVAAEPKPVFVVIRTKRSLTGEQTQNVARAWEHFRKLSPDIPPACVLGPGFEIEVMREA